MPRLIWSPPALRDIARLHRFLAEKNPEAAQRAIAAFRKSVSLLGMQPQVGRPVADMEVEFREWPIAFGSSGYLVLYRYDAASHPGDAVILAVRHQKECGY